MKVFVVTSCDGNAGSGWCYEGVFSTREKAEEAVRLMRAQNKGWNLLYSYEIEEVDVQ